MGGIFYGPPKLNTTVHKSTERTTIVYDPGPDIRRDHETDSSLQPERQVVGHPSTHLPGVRRSGHLMRLRHHIVRRVDHRKSESTNRRQTNTTLGVYQRVTELIVLRQ